MIELSSNSRFVIHSLLGASLTLALAGCEASRPSTTSASAGASGAAGAGTANTGGAGAHAGPASPSNAAGGANAASGSSNAGAASSAGGVAGTSHSANAGGNSGSAGSGGTKAELTLLPLVTSAPDAYWKSGAFIESSATTADVTVNDALIGQTWDGFGAAFNEQGWAALTSSEMQEQAVQLLFSESNGAAFTWGRIPIGANDYAVSRYTLDDTGPDVTPTSDESNRPAADIALSMFSIARDREQLIPYVQAARAVKSDLRFWASPWSPPVWMKTGFRKSDGWSDIKKPSYYDGGSMRSDAAILASYAQYFTKFIQSYAAEGIDVELVAAQEEPSFEQSYPSCVWDKVTYTNFVGQFLGPAMTQLGVKIMVGTLADENKDIELGAAALADSKAKSFATLIGAQWNALAWDKKLVDLNSNLPIWATEHQGGNYPWNPSGFPPYQSYAPNDQAYGVETWGRIRDAINKAKVTSYNAWNLVLDKNGWSIDTTRQWAQNALLVADSGTVTATPAYYVFRHLSQYVVPGARVIGTTGGDALAFKNPDGSVTVVMFNGGAANDHYVLAVGGKMLEFAMPSNGWASLKYNP